MGARNRTQQNLEVVRTDAARGLIFVRGSVPGSKGGWLLVKDAVKVPVPEGAPFPGAMRRNADETATEDAPAGMIEADAQHEAAPEPTDAEIAAAAAEMEANKAEEAKAEAEAAATEEKPAEEAKTDAAPAKGADDDGADDAKKDAKKDDGKEG